MIRRRRTKSRGLHTEFRPPMQTNAKSNQCMRNGKFAHTYSRSSSLSLAAPKFFARGQSKRQPLRKRVGGPSAREAVDTLEQPSLRVPHQKLPLQPTTTTNKVYIPMTQRSPNAKLVHRSSFGTLNSTPSVEGCVKVILATPPSKLHNMSPDNKSNSSWQSDKKYPAAKSAFHAESRCRTNLSYVSIASML